jgi:signal transduction histidine kinase
VGQGQGAGIGIGLVSMRERAVALGGTLAIESAPGRGTTLEVRLPLREPQSVEEPA